MEPIVTWTLFELAEIVGGELHGPADLRISKPVPAGDPSSDGITFAESPKYVAVVEATTVGAVIVAHDEVNCHKPHIRCRSPREAFGRILAMAWRDLPLAEGIHATAIVSPNATVDNGAHVGAYSIVESGAVIRSGARVYAHCYVGANCHLSDGVKLYPHATLYRDVFLGERAIVHSGAVIGADGFGYFWDGKRHRKVPQAGGVRIGDDCEIGALTSIDRATAGDTVIERGTKIDNLVQIAHNVRVGEDSVIASQAGVAGSSRIGKRNTLAGQVGVRDHATIADDVILAAATTVSSDIGESGVYWGTPVARPVDRMKRIVAAMNSLPELMKRIRELEQEIRKLRSPDED